MSDVRDELVGHLSGEPFTELLPEEWDIVVGEDWHSKGKYESSNEVVKHLPSGRFFEVYFTRYRYTPDSYETSFEGLIEVEPYEKVVIAYREVKAQ